MYLISLTNLLGLERTESTYVAGIGSNPYKPGTQRYKDWNNLIEMIQDGEMPGGRKVPNINGNRSYQTLVNAFNGKGAGNSKNWIKISGDELKKIGTQADQKDIRAIKGTANDAFNFFKAQVTQYKEVSKGVFVGKDANGVTFIYRASSKSGPPTIDVNGIKGIRKIKFL